MEDVRDGMDQALLARCPITEGTVIGVLGLHFGLWSLNACRIVYVIEEEAILFVISLAVSRVAGQTLLVDGGETA
jgi:hypothetical protein